MKVLIFSPIYYIEGRANLVHDSNAVHYLVKSWAKEHEIHVIHLYSQSLKTLSRYFNRQERQYYRDGYYYEKDNVKIAMCEMQRIRVTSESTYVTRRLVQFTKQYLQKVDFHPDVIVSHMPTMTVKAIAQLGIQVPKIAVLHQTDIKLTSEKSELVHCLNECFDSIYCRSKKIRDYFLTKTNLRVKSELVHSGIPVNCNRSAIGLKRYSDKPIILYTGRLIKRKHVDLIIEALSQMDDFDFVFKIIGKGKEKKKLLQAASKLMAQGKCEFLDYMPREQVFDEMMRASIFVMPSTEETLGLVYLEAMSQGCICIGTRGEGIDGIIVDGENGFLVEPRNVVALRDNIVEALNLDLKMDLMIRNNALSTAEHYNDLDMSVAYKELILKEIESK